MKDYDPTSPQKTLFAWSALSAPSVAAVADAAPPHPHATPANWSAGKTAARQPRKPKVRRSLTKKKCRSIVTTALLASMF